jgi:hypothetical protein
MEYTTQELETMLDALSASIIRLESEYNSNGQQERVGILWEIQQLTKIEKVLLNMIKQ